MAPRDSSTTASSIPPPSRQASGPTTLPPNRRAVEERVTPQAVAALSPPSDSLGFPTPPRSNLSSLPHSPTQHHHHDNNDDDDDSDIMPAPSVSVLVRNKRRGGSRFLFWACALVVVLVVVILLEDEHELRRTDGRVKSLSWKGLPEPILTQNNLAENDENDSAGQTIDSRETATTSDTDDDGWTNWFGQKSVRSGSYRLANNDKPTIESTVLKDKITQKLQPFPVIQYDDDHIPQSVAGSFLHASDALLCRDSVIDYVINATDLKDECDGLKKAFTKHCADEDEPTLTKRRRRLLTDQTIQISENPVLRLHKHIFYLSQRLHSWWYAPDNSVFMAEDQILEAWEDASFEVEHGWDLLYRDEDIAAILRYPVSVRDTSSSSPEGDLQHRRSIEEKTSNDSNRVSSLANSTRRDTEHRSSNDGELEKDKEVAVKIPVEQPTEAQNKTVVSKDSNKHMANLALPITNRHISEKILTETLMLQQDQKIIKAVQNQTNHTFAQADAAASKKAVSDAADYVTSVLNDPTSVEARTCCTSILNVFHENCSVDEEEELSDSRLFVTVVVIAFCGLVKSLIRHFSIRWLPEAAGCILVGVMAGYILTFFPHHDMSFDGNWFLRILVPPIVFEAALSIDKRSFNRHIVPILFYAVIGTLLASGITAIVVHEGSVYLRGLCETIPYPEALAFGALISSIDPIAVLSVLSNMGMTDLDTIYVVIFGESLLNDGVAIVLFETLVHFLDDNMEVDGNAVTAAAIHFVVVFVGSFLIGIASGLCCTVYYWLMLGCQTPLVEVLMFCCWALLPYYICDGIEWSGIVAVVAAGFIMDMYVVGTNSKVPPPEPSNENGHASLNGSISGSFLEDSGNEKDRRRGQPLLRRPIFSKDGLLGTEAKTHIGFVTEIIATMMETAIFAYLGLFLFSSRYHWNFYHIVIAIAGCCISRAVMIPIMSLAANWLTRAQQVGHKCRSQQLSQQSTLPDGIKTAAGVIIDRKMQLVLWFAGLRGAMSFALVEHIPLYDSVTGEGTRLKSELKAMTSASIIFTVFVLGGGTFYMMDALGMAPSQAKDGGGKSSALETEMVGLLRTVPVEPSDYDDREESNNSDHFPDERKEVYTSAGTGSQGLPPKLPGRPVRRQRKNID
ncbi:sodium/hydrogen exchanger [Nitzschia inconspicua]|uniref:Sodium/hydrogen exchanger n=1 Tax=Nitzschia inconspicua TaxID=303405 RepID=A0A9K3LPU2_9STRA|nr:sodium/hydrogen exchanger [Nitzschia inconspicua]